MMKFKIDTGTLVVLATRNGHKVAELEQLLAGRLTVIALPEDVLPGELSETGTTLAENSAQKARAVADATGGYALADDSGLEIDALGGEPGLHSAHYSGTRDSGANMELVISKLSAFQTKQKRAARFVCVLTLAGPEGSMLQVSGSVEGTIAHERSGVEGFGYDPIFVPEGYGLSFADLAQEVKAGMSHRARAVQALIELI
jgi:XTP/dITP diphosphohydrolase